MSYQFPPAGQVQPGGQMQPGGPTSGGPGRRGPGGMAAAVVLIAAGILLLTGGVAVALSGGGSSGSVSAQPSLSGSTIEGLSADPSAWTKIPVTQLFPGTITVGGSDISWVRLGILAPASCASVLTSEWTADTADACSRVLRAVYMDRARSIVATIALIVMPPSLSNPNVWPGLTAAVSAQDTPARLASSVPYPVRVAGVPGTPAASWSDPDIQAFSSPDSTSYGFQPVVEAGTLDGRDAGRLPAGWVTRTGSKYDRESWFGPANDLMVVYDSYLADLAGLQGMPTMPAIPGSAS
jgi:hypothetical protein